MKSNKKGEDMKNILLAIVFIGSLVSLNALHAQVWLAEQSGKEASCPQWQQCTSDKDCPVAYGYYCLPVDKGDRCRTCMKKKKVKTSKKVIGTVVPVESNK